MPTLQLDDILIADGLFDSKKKQYYKVIGIYPIYSKPDDNGEVNLEKTAYRVKQIDVPWDEVYDIYDYQIGTDIFLYKRTYPSGIILEFSHS